MDCFDVGGDTTVDVVSASDDDYVLVVVVIIVVVVVIGRVVWVVEGSMSPLQVRLSTILKSSTVIMIT